MPLGARQGAGGDVNSRGVQAMSALSIVGAIVLLLGLFLFIGNVTSIFPTFPLAGYLTVVIGGAMCRVGRTQQG